MMQLATQIEELALDFGRRFSDVAPNPPIDCPDRLREMVVAAAIGSGVRYDLASSMAKTLVEDPSSQQIELVSERHRFPNQTKARLNALFADQTSMLDAAVAWLDRPKCVFKNRKLMAKLVPGLGPKQSSFLFSCTGYGQEIAVLDRHILKYLQLVGLTDISNMPSSWKKYEEIEAEFLSYSAQNCIRADALDLAIWITMKAAGRRTTECAQ
jgi:thermostable 8-oxoguanine DNA glycosylase